MSQHLPDWFRRHCIKDAEAIETLANQLSINDRDQAASQSGYEINSCIYERFTDYLFGAGCNTIHNGQPTKLVHNGFILRLPDDNDTGDGFFVSVAARLAADFGAKMIVLDYQNIQDLAEHAAGPRPFFKPWDGEYYMRRYFPPPVDKKWVSLQLFTSDFKSDDGEKKYDSADIFRAILSNLGAESAVIVILRSGEFGQFWRPVCKALRTAISTSGMEERVLVIAAGNATDSQGKDYGLDSFYLNTRPAPRRLDVFPQRTKSQEALFKEATETQIAERNKRVLQQAIRSVRPLAAQILTEPYAEWQIPDSSAASALLSGGKRLTWREARGFAERMLGPFPLTMDIIVSVLNRYTEEEKATQNWGYMSDTHSEEPTNGDGATGSLFGSLLGKSSRSSRSSNSNNDEINTMETLVDKYWSHIEVDPVVISQVKRMILLLERRSQLSGILKREAGGALIYGPPGTGKTHLARIIAKETSSTMIRATAADINSKWTGVAENNVKNLFKFARSRSPAVVFFDDADGLFRQRGGDDDKPWRQDVTNAFLNEVGGFANDPRSPLLVLATNFPNKVDTAVPRRVPNKIFIGFPTRSGRQNIFRICLREEKLGRDVEFAALAAQTPRFTGSDIEFVCHQAASAALEEVSQSSAPIEMPICLELKHFNRAMEVASPSADLAMMKDMIFFASRYDRPSMVRMNKPVEE
ncbi:unnamed protein product [Clonostachys rosea]|uniref:AAA+ ATPase domain-containing protein n=1 Tax=Bionectria ochroleuca TaxID=29856 RepID=A0ABY6U6S7_BIOOC|nr:unnamed protein product [Clonostachys rosea]